MDFCKIPFTSARSGLARFTQTVAYYLPLPFIPVEVWYQSWNMITL